MWLHKYTQAGFTLIELMVSISIIALLTALVVPNFMGARERANDSQRRQSMVAMKNALRLYYNDNQSYPPGTGVSCTIIASDYLLAPKNYLPSAEGIGCTYSQGATSSDEFLLQVGLNANAGGENGLSQLSCGIAVGATDATTYMICVK